MWFSTAVVYCSRKSGPRGHIGRTRYQIHVILLFSQISKFPEFEISKFTFFPTTIAPLFELNALYGSPHTAILQYLDYAIPMATRVSPFSFVGGRTAPALYDLTIRSLFPAQLSDFEVVLGGKGSDTDTINRSVIDIRPSISHIFSHSFHLQKFIYGVTPFGDVRVGQLLPTPNLLTDGPSTIPFPCLPPALHRRVTSTEMINVCLDLKRL